MTGTDGRARGDGGRHSANGDARGQRGRPFPAEFEVPPGDIVDGGPEDEVGHDNRADSLEHHRAGQAKLLGRRDSEKTAQNHDGRLDVQLRADGFFYRTRQRREEVADGQPREERDDETGLRREAERPGKSEGLAFVGGGGDVGPASDEPGQIAREKHRRKTL